MGLSIRSHIIDSLTEFVGQNGNLFGFFDNIYLFGSVLNNDKPPNDVDILLVYSNRLNDWIANLDDIDRELERICGLPIDLTVLSVDEERAVGFIKRIGAYRQLK